MIFTPENITHLEPNQIFVFGSNLAGRHGAGAAYLACQKFGAVYGVGVGPSGQTYAIPTKDNDLRILPLSSVRDHVLTFLQYAVDHPEKQFLVTQIGCGLAGYCPEDIAPFFKKVSKNVVLPESFVKINENSNK